MEIGTPEDSERPLSRNRRKSRSYLYGTSIAQGACSSRPAMAWANILQRSLGYPLINLGFSGNGKLEKEVLNYIIEQDARIYILDCLPNLTPNTEQEVTGPGRCRRKTNQGDPQRSHPACRTRRI